MVGMAVGVVVGVAITRAFQVSKFLATKNMYKTSKGNYRSKNTGIL